VIIMLIVSVCSDHKPFSPAGPQIDKSTIFPRLISHVRRMLAALPDPPLEGVLVAFTDASSEGIGEIDKLHLFFRSVSEEHWLLPCAHPQNLIEFGRPEDRISAGCRSANSQTAGL